MKSMFPCIHHNVDSKSLPYKYSQELNFSLSLSGCATAIKREKKIVAWGIIGRIVLMILTQVNIFICFLNTYYIFKYILGSCNSRD